MIGLTTLFCFGRMGKNLMKSHWAKKARCTSYLKAMWTMQAYQKVLCQNNAGNMAKGHGGMFWQRICYFSLSLINLLEG